MLDAVRGEEQRGGESTAAGVVCAKARLGESYRGGAERKEMQCQRGMRMSAGAREKEKAESKRQFPATLWPLTGGG